MTNAEIIENARRVLYGHDPDEAFSCVEIGQISAALGVARIALRAQQEAEKNAPLTLDELRKMPGEPVWCAEYQHYGIVKVETVGCWANKPYLVGSLQDPKYGTAVDFEYDIKKRGLTLYRRKPEEG